MKVIEVQGLAETIRLAETLASLLAPPDVITLEGDLGAGKTTFTQALAKALGVKRTVNSPTFTILKQYEGSHFPFNHLDVYRLADSEEDLGFEELFFGDAVSVVEWAQFIEPHLPEERLAVTIEHLGDDKRRFTFEPAGAHFEKICEAISL